MDMPETKAQAHRGTIILDACTIKALAAPIPKAFLTGKARHPVTNYLDLLPFLAANGYRILIPETVAVEAADVLSNGRSLQEIFNRGFRHESMRLSLPFLKKAGEHRFPNIEIVADTGPVEADTYCQRLRAVMDQYLTAMEQPTKFTNTARSRLTSEVAKTIRQTNRKNLGDKAIKSLATQLLKANATNNMVLFTEDRELGRALEPDINWISHRTLMHYFMESGLGTQVGIEKTVDADELEMDIEMHEKHRDRGYFSKFSAGPTERYIDAIHNNRSCLFLGTLKSLNEELLSAPPPPKPTMSKTAREALLEKFGAPRTNGRAHALP